MSIRICGGIYRSRKLACPSKGVRPTSDRVKEAVFSTLGADMDGWEVLDLFSGSGSLGIEAISRGAGEVVFVDKSRKCIKTVEENLNSLGAKDKASIIHLDARAFVHKCKDKFDLIFMDPPYNKGLATQMAPIVCRLLAGDGILVIEHSPREEIDPPKAEIWKKSIYGDTCVTYIKKEVESQ